MGAVEINDLYLEEIRVFTSGFLRPFLEACRRRPLLESWSRPAGGALSLGHYQRVKVVYDETIEVVIDSHEFTPGPIGEF